MAKKFLLFSSKPQVHGFLSYWPSLQYETHLNSTMNCSEKTGCFNVCTLTVC